MLRATNATATWDPTKKHWQVQIHVGATVIKRALSKVDQNAPEDTLRSLAVQTAKDEGYDLDLTNVAVAAH